MKQAFLAITFFLLLAMLPISNFAQQNPFPGCNFVLEDAACSSFFGFSETKVQSIIGKSDSWGDYYSYGVHLYYGSNSELNSINFRGTKSNSTWGQIFSGKPHKNFDWGASPEEVISKYRQPDSQRTFNLPDYVETEFYYGKNVVVQFRDGKLTLISLIAPPPPTNKNPLANLDCKIILSETCVPLLMKASPDDIKSYYGSLMKETNFTQFTSDKPRFSFYSVGIVSRIYFYTGSGSIVQGINWGAKKDAIIKKFGTPKDSMKGKNGDGDNYEIIWYENIKFEFIKGKLSELELKNKLSESEASAVSAKHQEEKLAAELAAERFAKTPEGIAQASAKKSQEMEADYKSLLGTIELYNEEGERILKQNMTLMAMGGQWAEDVRKKLDKVDTKMVAAIERFLKRYEGQVPDWMIKGIQAKRSGQ